MNNQIKTILFILLGVALFFTLYFVLHLEIEKKLSTASNVPNNEKTSVVTSTLLPDAKIAFVNIDTLNEKYLFIADYVKAMKKRKETIEAQLQAMMNQFQNDYEAFQQSVQAGIAPQAELEKQKRKLEQQQKEIQNKQLQMDNLALELQEKNEQLQRDIKEFMKRFNNGKYDYIISYSDALPNVLYANPKYDITKEVLDALNKEYLEKKSNQKP
jgi:outer membrane protein